jgi:hypothetical protein
LNVNVKSRRGIVFRKRNVAVPKKNRHADDARKKRRKKGIEKPRKSGGAKRRRRSEEQKRLLPTKGWPPLAALKQQGPPSPTSLVVEVALAGGVVPKLLPLGSSWRTLRTHQVHRAPHGVLTVARGGIRARVLLQLLGENRILPKGVLRQSLRCRRVLALPALPGTMTGILREMLFFG